MTRRTLFALFGAAPMAKAASKAEIKPKPLRLMKPILRDCDFYSPPMDKMLTGDVEAIGGVSAALFGVGAQNYKTATQVWLERQERNGKWGRSRRGTQ